MTHQSLLLRSARIVLPHRVAEVASVLVEDDGLAGIVESGSTESIRADAVIDLDGLTLFPGFIDVHIHGAVGVDTMEAGADGLSRISEFLASQGVTGWLPTFVPAPAEHYARASDSIEDLMREQSCKPGRLDRAAQTEGLRSETADNGAAAKDMRGSPRSQKLQPRSQGGARVLGVHYEGPFVNTLQCGALRSAYFKSFSKPSDVDALPTPNEKTCVRMMTLAPEIEGGLNLVQELNKRGWVVSIGHTRADTSVLEGAFKAGAHHLTHFMNAMAPLHHRSPGPVGWGLSRDDVTCDVIADGFHLDPYVLRLLLSIKGADRLSLISDAIAAAGKGDGAYEIWGETIAVKDGQTRNARGSIAGSVITMLDAVRKMLSLGASEVEVARMAATNPARLLGIDNDCGSIEEGKRADLVALDDAGNVRLTMVGGGVAFLRELANPERSLRR